MATVFVTALAGVFAWSTIVRLWLGSSDADNSRGSPASVGRTGFGWFGQGYERFGVIGIALIVAFLLVLVGLAYTPRARNWGAETRAWFWAYPAFLTVGTTVHTGQLRYFLTAFPLLFLLVPSPPVHGSPKTRILLVTFVCLIGLGLQWLWIDQVLIIHNEGYSVWLP